MDRGGIPAEVDLASLEAQVHALARNWEDRVVDALVDVVGESEANRLASRWTPAFPEYYKSSTLIELVVGDIMSLDHLEASGKDLVVGVNNESRGVESGGVDEPASPEPLARITVYRTTGKLVLSAIMPLIEHLGLTVVEEVPTRLKGEEGTFIHDVGVLMPDGSQLDVEEVGDRVTAAIEAVLTGEAESDSLHRLLVTTGLDHHQLAILRAYRNYWRLVTPSFSVGYVDDTFALHPGVAEALVKLFNARFGERHDEDDAREIAKTFVDGSTTCRLSTRTASCGDSSVWCSPPNVRTSALRVGSRYHSSSLRTWFQRCRAPNRCTRSTSRHLMSKASI